MSGYRETETQQFIDTTYYDFLDEDKYSASRENYNVVLPVDQIISSHLFDVSTYRDKFNGLQNS